ncbi:MAG: hypothetical protein ACERKO_10905, partial [Acetanaerobacterium sp.]
MDITMKRTFGGLFAAMVGQENISPVLTNGAVLHLDINNEQGTLGVTVRLDATASKKELWALEELMAHKMGLVRVTILPQYDEALLSAAYFPELFCALRRMGKIVNGFLDDAKITVDDRQITITLCHGGQRLLSQTGFEQALRMIIHKEFSAAREIVFDGVCELSAEQSKPDDLPEQVMPPSANRDTAPPKTKEAPRPREDRPKKESASVQKQNGALYEGLPIVSGTTKVLFGKSIRDRPIDLCEVTTESGKVVVWGDVLTVNKKETRDGEKYIYAIDFTDYSSSNTLKMICDKKRDKAKVEKVDGLKTGTTILVRGEASY